MPVATKRFPILIYSEKQEDSERLASTLLSSDFNFFLTSTESALYKELENLTEPIIVYFTNKTDEKIKIELTNILEKNILTSLPLIFVGNKSESFQKVTEGISPLVSSISPPFTTKDIINELNRFKKELEKKKPEKNSRTKINNEMLVENIRKSLQTESIEQIGNDEKISNTENESDNQTLTKKDVLKPEHQTYTIYSGVPELFFNQIVLLKLDKIKMGGSVLSKASFPSKIKDFSYIPKDEQVESYIKEIKSNFSKWELGHTHRVAYLNSQIITALQISQNFIENSQKASFLISLGFESDRKKLLRTDFSRDDETGFRFKLCSKIKDSAFRTVTELELPDTANIMTYLARLIAKEQQVNDEEISICSSSIMCSEIIDRCCWSSGIWDPRAAYNLLRRCYRGELKEIHPQVLTCMIKILIEAIHETPVERFISRKAFRDPEMMRSIRENLKNRVTDIHESVVPIALLTPGMVLSKPLIGYDGKVVLSDKVKLDEDIILRIWCLSSLYALQSPLVLK